MFRLYRKDKELTLITEDEDKKVLIEQTQYLIGSGKEDNLIIKDNEGLVIYAEGSVHQPNSIHDLVKITTEEYYNNDYI